MVPLRKPGIRKESGFCVSLLQPIHLVGAVVGRRAIGKEEPVACGKVLRHTDRERRRGQFRVSTQGVGDIGIELSALDYRARTGASFRREMRRQVVCGFLGGRSRIGAARCLGECRDLGIDHRRNLVACPSDIRGGLRCPVVHDIGLEDLIADRRRGIGGVVSVLSDGHRAC